MVVYKVAAGSRLVIGGRVFTAGDTIEPKALGAWLDYHVAAGHVVAVESADPSTDKE